VLSWMAVNSTHLPHVAPRRLDYAATRPIAAINIWLPAGVGKTRRRSSQVDGFGRVATVHCRRCGVEPLALTG
jgi:hypothetical protein